MIVSEAMHAIIGHRSKGGEPFTVEAGILRVADALDMARGRSRMAFEAGRLDIHSISAYAIEDVKISPGEDRAVRVEIAMSNSAGIYQVDELLAQQTPRIRPRGTHRGDRPHRRRAREATAHRVQDLTSPGIGSPAMKRALAIAVAATVPSLLAAPSALATTQTAQSGNVSATFTFSGSYPNFTGLHLSIAQGAHGLLRRAGRLEAVRDVLRAGIAVWQGILGARARPRARRPARRRPRPVQRRRPLLLDRAGLLVRPGHDDLRGDPARLRRPRGSRSSTSATTAASSSSPRDDFVRVRVHRLRRVGPADPDPDVLGPALPRRDPSVPEADQTGRGGLAQGVQQHGQAALLRTASAWSRRGPPTRSCSGT